MINPDSPDYKNTPVSKQRTVFKAILENQQSEPKITIITPFYNTGKIFYETAQSVFQQSFQQWEWLIINDGSTDSISLKILSEYRKIDPRVRVIDHLNNLGLSASRNTGFREARTEYILQLDSDDLLEPTAAEKWYWYLLTHPECAFIKGQTVGFGAQEYLWSHGFHDGPLFLTENPADATSMIKKSVHSIIGGYEEKNQGGLEDWDFWLHCATHGFWGTTIPEFQDWYRIRPQHRERWENWNAHRIDQFLKQARYRYPTLWEKGFPKLLSPDLNPVNIDQKLEYGNILLKDKRRLLLILPWMRVGGADKFNLDLLRQLTLRNWDVSIITTLAGDHSWAPEFAKFTSDIFILDHFLRPKDFPGFIRYLVESRQFDLILISNSILGYQLSPFLRHYFPDITLLDLCHMEDENGQFGAYPAISLKYQNYLDFHITSTDHLRKEMINHGILTDRIATCTTNIDEKEIAPDIETRLKIRSEFDIFEDQTLILFIGRLCKQKQPLVLVQTCAILRNRNLNFKCIVVGDGPDREIIEQYVAKNKLSNYIIILGAQPHEKLKNFMNAADIFFLPSEWEGIALTIYEAMAVGVPVVSADVGGQRELVTPDCGLLLHRGENEAQRYADLLTDLILDPERKKAMGEAGRLRITRFFTLNQMGTRMEELLDNAIHIHKFKNVETQVTEEEALISGQLAAKYAEAHSTWVEPPSQPQSVTNQKIADNNIQVPGHSRLYKLVKTILHLVYSILLKIGFKDIVKVKVHFKKVYNLSQLLIHGEPKLKEIIIYNSWLEQQRSNWQITAEELRKGNEYLESQRSKWEKTALELQKEKDEFIKQMSNPMDK